MHHAHIDKLAYQDSPIHKLDARAKLIVILAFTFAVISVGKYSLSILACCAVGPFAVLVIAQIPLRFVLKQLVIVSPFVAALALSCIYYNNAPADIIIGPFQWHTTAGTIQFFNILAKFALTVCSLMALICTTRFADLLAAMQSLKVPQVLTTQLGFLYRYIFVLIDRVHHIILARSARTLRNLGFKLEIRVAAAMVGSLLVSTIETSEKINIAMISRGFDGRFRSLNRLKFQNRDYVFFAVAIVFITLILILKRYL